METAGAALKLAINFIERLGFPIFVAVWVLIVQERALKRLTEAIKCLTAALNGGRVSVKRRKRGGD